MGAPSSVPEPASWAGVTGMERASSTSSLTNSLPASRSDTGTDASSGVYEDDSGILQQISRLTESIQSLKSLPPSAHVTCAIEQIYEQLKEIESNWRPAVRINAICNASATATSLETRLMINKYSEDVSLTRFSTIQPSPVISRVSVLNQQPVVDDMFGLYSPGLLLSVRGIGYLFKSFFDPGVKMAREYKTTLYLMLRFFDTCFHYLDLAVKSWSEPLKSHFIMIPKDMLSHTDLIKYLVDQVPLAVKKKTEAVYPAFPQPASFEERLPMFHWVVRLMNTLHLETSGDCLDIEENGLKMPFVKDLIRIKEAISILSFEYLNLTMHTPVGDLDFFESLLILIKHQYWIGEYHLFYQLLSLATGYAQNLGIHRWEFYVGMDEEMAEKRRCLWWKCYFWDKLFSIHTGKQAIICEAFVNCLLPKYFQQLGILDAEEFLAKVTTMNENLEGSGKDLILYFVVALSLIVGDFFDGVLYNKKYTNFRNQAKPHSLRERLVKDLVKDVNIFISRFDAIERQSHVLSKFSVNPENSTTLSPEEIEFSIQAAGVSSVLQFAVSVCLGSVEHLFARFKVGEFPDIAAEAISGYKKRVYGSWKLVMDAMGRRSVHLVWQTMNPGCVLFLTILTDVFTQHNQHAIDDIILVLKAARNLDLLGYFEDPTDEVGSSRVLRQLTKGRTFLHILVRISLQLFMRTSHIPMSDMLSMIADRDMSLVSLAENILDGTNRNFGKCFVARERTSVHLHIERSLEQEQRMGSLPSAPLESSTDFSQTKSTHSNTPFTDVKDHALDGKACTADSKEAVGPPSPQLSLNLGTLDDFLNCGEDDLYTKLWSDINVEFIDLLPHDSQ